MSLLAKENQCYRCGKPYKTPTAKFCAYCGINYSTDSASNFTSLRRLSRSDHWVFKSVCFPKSSQCNRRVRDNQPVERKGKEVFVNLVAKSDQPTKLKMESSVAASSSSEQKVEAVKKIIEVSEENRTVQPTEPQLSKQASKGDLMQEEKTGSPEEGDEVKDKDTTSKQPADDNESENLNTQSSNSSLPPRELVVAAHSETGRRKRNEDAHTVITSLPEDPSTAFFAVYDGHGGAKASAYCSKKLHGHLLKRKSYKTDKKKALRKSFIVTDEKYLGKFEKDGCTVLVSVLTHDNHLLVANAGDSRAILGRDGKAIALSKDHKPQDPEEKKRIEDSGHDVVKDSALFNGQRITTYRIDGITAVSRSIGDADFKDSYGKGPEEQACTCIPDITDTEVKNGDFFVLACDGLWDVMSNEEVAEFVAQHKATLDLQSVAAKLVETAIEKGSQDNVTAIIVYIP